MNSSVMPLTIDYRSVITNAAVESAPILMLECGKPKLDPETTDGAEPLLALPHLNRAGKVFTLSGCVALADLTLPMGLYGFWFCNKILS
jgi:hypothetical protein